MTECRCEWLLGVRHAVLGCPIHGKGAEPDACTDDAVGPSNIYLCTLDDGHPGRHEAWGGGKLLEAWQRGEGTR